MHVHSKYTSTYSSIPGTYSSIQDMYQFWYCCTTDTSDGGRATAGERCMYTVIQPVYLVLLCCCCRRCIMSIFHHFRLVSEPRARRPGQVRPRISPWVRGHGYRQGETGALPPRGPALVEA